MLGLHKLDNTSAAFVETSGLLSPARDCIEAEERRRTFWYLFYSDRWAGSASGRSYDIREEEASSLLDPEPSSTDIIRSQP